MARGIQYKVVSYVMIDGVPHEFSGLDSQTRERCAEKMLGSMSRTLSDYYSAHTDEARTLMQQPCVEVAG